MIPRAIALAVALAVSFQALADEVPADAEETILAIQLDGKEVIDTTLVKQSKDGDVWLTVEDWKRLPRVALDLKGKTGLLSAKSLGLSVEFIESAQAVNLLVPSDKRPEQRLGPTRERTTSTNAQPKGVLVNYDVAALAQQDGRYGVSIGHEARMGVGAATLVTTGQLNHTGEGVEYRRGVTTLNYDHLPTGVAVQVGDVFTPRTNLTSTAAIGGVRVTSDRALRRDQSFIPGPMLGGIVQSPTTAEVLVNGRRTSQHSLKPGPWRADHFPVQQGSNTVQVVLRDDFGREEVSEERFYVGPNQLPKGTTEWEVSAGLLRQGGGYRTPAIAARIDRGIRQGWTLGAGVQATSAGTNVSLSNRVSLGTKGAVNVDVAVSNSDIGQGAAWSASYDYRSDNLSIGAGHTAYAGNYWTLSNSPVVGADAMRIASTSTLAVSLNPRGAPWSASAGVASVTYESGDTKARASVGARYRRGVDDFGAGVAYTTDDRDVQGFVTWRHAFNGNTSMSATARKAPDPQLDVRASGRNPVLGKEVRWAGGLNHQENGDSAWMQGAVGTSKGSLSVSAVVNDGTSRADARFQGSVWAGEGGITFQEASQGSFLVVEVEGQKGVPVSAGGAFASKTNRRGVAVVPNVQPLVSHQVALEAKTLSESVGLETTIKPATARRRGGAKVEFKVLSDSMLEVHLVQAGIPVDGPASVTTDTEEALLGHGGVTVLMKPTPGQTLRVHHSKGVCTAALPTILPTDGLTVDLECKDQP